MAVAEHGTAEAVDPEVLCADSGDFAKASPTEQDELDQLDENYREVDD